jgi:hypothetical protein
MRQHLGIALALSLVAACGGSSSVGSTTSGEQGELVVEVTDKPFDYDLVVSAVVRVDEIRVHKEADGEAGFVTLYSGQQIEFDLLDLTNGVTKTLVRADLPVGTYEQVRLHVVGGRIELVDGDVFSTELGNLQLTSTGTSGLKILIDPPVEVLSELSTTLLLDFDLSKTFHAVPANDPLNAAKFQLHPVLHAVNKSMTGEVAGVVQVDDGQGGLAPVDMATVYLQPFGDPDPANSIAATASTEDGSYRLIGVPAGTWDVLAIKGDLQGTFAGVEVEVGNVSHADIVIE